MKFFYRGAHYEADPLIIEVTEGEIGGLYRSSPWKIHEPKQKYRLRQASFALTYRGAHYKH
ncbi:DUF4278 domain-containing protein [Gloeocapsa sp. PCC 73106]|uniref:DUF4278 domain-containing protein n=1 Tax=Gloeocapsa sp. PCC 73106 TaxID=102232 RepID=UPI0002AC2623|nr:DUF4278 domain-containing protein [Gloeocapsa sp. PCC 73106]ELR99929.1 hypothetical protein GLO73106DRAFT_00037820 [Gloeocapsa sp. PCC 73106]